MSPPRAQIPSFLSSFVEGVLADEGRRVAEAVLAQAGDDEIAAALDAVGRAGAEWGLSRAHPLVRRLARAWILALLGPVDRAGEPPAGPGLWVCNHLSYVDAQVIDALLERDDLLVVAGPKVYTHPFRRIAAAALNTLKTPQSAAVASEEAAMPPREVAALALRSVEIAAGWMREGGAVLLFPEGTRSRDGALLPFLRGAGRYGIGAPRVVPMALSGTDAFFGRDERIRPARVGLRIGAPFVPEGRGWLEVAAGRVAALVGEPRGATSGA